jgi:hypothetical protein
VTDGFQAKKQNVTGWRTILYTHNGKPEEIAVELPANADSDDNEEAKSFVETLEANEQIQHEPGPLKPGKTHQVETDLQGNKRLVRKLYNAI